MQSGCSVMRLPELPCEHPAEASRPLMTEKRTPVSDLISVRATEMA